MTPDRASLTINRKDLTKGLVLRMRMPRGFGLRLRLGAWLIGLAGRVIDVPVEVELIHRPPA